MRAMILAAGRGERMRPLTDALPKPLLRAGGRPLIVWHLLRLSRAGFHDVVINHAWQGHKLEQALGDGRQYGLRLHYSAESAALETAGGIAHALPLLGDAPFLVVNGDVWCDWQPERARAQARALHAQGDLAWLLLADNPAHHPQGDFLLDDGGRVLDPDQARPVTSGTNTRLTFTGIGVYHPALFAGVPAGQPAALAPLLRQAMRQGNVIGAHYNGEWLDIGTPARLADLDARLQASPPAHLHF